MPTSNASHGAISHKVIRGGMLLMGGQIFTRMLGIVSTVFLARLLSPDDYGVVAMAMVFIGFVDTVSDIQIGTAVMRIREPQPSHFDTAFTISLARGMLMALILCAIAAYLAEFHADKRVAGALLALSLSPLLGGAANPRIITFEKDLKFKVVFWTGAIVNLVSTVTTVVLAFLLHSYWAIIFGTLASQVVNVIIGYALIPTRPGFSIRHFREFLSFGGWLTAANTLAYANYKLDTLIVGSRLGTATLGIYSMGDRLAQMMTNELAGPFARAFYPGLASVAHDIDRLRSAYYRSQEIVLAVILPIGVGVALCAHEIVTVVAGQKWASAAIVVQFIAPIMALNTLAAAVQALAMTTGDTRALFMRNLANFVMRVPLILAGLFFYGMTGLLIARAITGTAFTITSLFLAARLTEDHVWTPLYRGRRSLIACLAMVAAVFAIETVLPLANATLSVSFTRLTAMILVGASTYVAVHLALWRMAGTPDGAERTMIQQIASFIPDTYFSRRGRNA